MQQAQKEREEAQYPYSGSDDETPETQVAGEPSSILHGPGENTLRQNFQALQEHNKVLFGPISKNVRLFSTTYLVNYYLTYFYYLDITCKE